MMKFVSKIREFFKQKDHEYLYLSEAVDLVDLEWRMRAIERGQAPYQRAYNSNLM